MNIKNLAPCPQSSPALTGIDSHISVLVADDHTFFRDGVSAVLERSPGIKVVGSATDGFQCVEAAINLRPRVVLMDIQMPRKSGFTATREILSACPDTRIIIFSMFEDSTMIRQAIASGAHGYLLKDVDAVQLLEAIHSVNRDSMIFGPGPAQRLAALLRNGSDKKTHDCFKELSQREIEVLSLLARDMTNQDIAMRLSISSKTVRNHVSNVLNKLGASSRYDAAQTARQAGIDGFQK